MLVLSRKVGEEILIGGNIRVAIHKIQGNSVRIAIDAPKDVVILRSEIVDLSENVDDDNPPADHIDFPETHTAGIGGCHRRLKSTS